MRADADVIIIGAGMAGLALARALAGPGLGLSLLVIDPREARPDRRVWVFPAPPGHALARFAVNETRAVRYAGRAGTLSAAPIWTVEAQAVQDAALDALSASSHARLARGVRLDDVRASAGRAELSCSLGLLRARQIIDTRPAPGHGVAAGAFTQIILSAEAPADGAEAGFELSAPQVQAGGLMLVQRHVLADGRMLAEAVRLAPPGDDGAGLKAVLDEALGGRSHTPARRAVLPLVPPEARKAPPGPVINAPARAGGLRFAVGLEALRLARWAQGATHDWISGRLISAPPDPGAASRAAALALHKRLRQAPKTAADWLNAQMTASDPDAVTAFLAGTARGD
ncbi:hypothetical protein F1654_12875 [Alkalicaulis satelles]|uniref:Lycopene cyclase n=1 Tax=Alkalicaulis satelles TaxID=2609175 RepID=A0A5M6Z8J5_9PROT|nr:lycopene cyclase family protein [Alkalicaulis satelles]KAA5800953.1 hypothetical protein F1654_12875 [Alkalicaulis satelles]